jgi:[ribosomal protein S18]-alanine N-acetyltransferase
MSLRSARHLLRSPAARVLIAEAAGVGGAAGALVLLSRRNSRSARIYSLVVHPRARGCGLAQALVRRAEAEARRRGCQAVSLEVRADNRAARSLYAGLGYCELKRLPEYYEDGADGLRLQRGFTARRG